MARAWDRLANLLANTDRPKEAEEASDNAVTALERLGDEFSNDPEYRQGLAAICSNRASRLHFARRYEEAEQYARRSTSLWEKLLEESPDNIQFQQGSAGGRNVLANIFKRLGKFEQARNEYRQALSVRQKLVAMPGDDVDRKRQLATAHRNLASVLQGIGQHDDAATQYRESIVIFEKLVVDYAAVPLYHAELAEAPQGLATTLTGSETWAEARSLIERAIREQRIAVEANPRQLRYRRGLRNHVYHLSTLLLENGDYTAASATIVELTTIVKEPYDFLTAGRLLILTRDTDLGPLRLRQDFRELVDELDKRANGP